MFLFHLGPSPRISHFSKNLQFPLMDNWMRGHNLDVTGCILLPFLWIELGKTAWAWECVCVCVCVCVYECVCIHKYIWSEVKVIQSYLTRRPCGLYNPWNSPGQNTGEGSHSFLQGIFPTQESKQGLLHCRLILYQLSHQGIIYIHTYIYIYNSVSLWHFNSITFPLTI